MAQAESEQSKRWGQIVTRAWGDPAFKKRLLADPGTVLKEAGVTVPPGVQVRIMEDTDRVFHLTLPQEPSSQGLAEEELEQVSAGALMRYEGTKPT